MKLFAVFFIIAIASSFAATSTDTFHTGPAFFRYVRKGLRDYLAYRGHAENSIAITLEDDFLDVLRLVLSDPDNIEGALAELIDVAAQLNAITSQPTDLAM